MSVFAENNSEISRERYRQRIGDCALFEHVDNFPHQEFLANDLQKLVQAGRHLMAARESLAFVPSPEEIYEHEDTLALVALVKASEIGRAHV